MQGETDSVGGKDDLGLAKVVESAGTPVQSDEAATQREGI